MSRTRSMSDINRAGKRKRSFKSKPRAQQELHAGKLYVRSTRGSQLVGIPQDGEYVSPNGIKEAKPSLSRMMPPKNLRGKTSDSSCTEQNLNECIKKIGTVATIEANSNPKVLLLDFDVARPVPRLTPILARLRVIGLRTKWASYRRTKRGWHVEIGIDVALTPPEHVAAQFACGSDPRRETMNLRRVISLRLHPRSNFWRSKWNILFQTKLV